jgi:hypothetical protein
MRPASQQVFPSNRKLYIDLEELTLNGTVVSNGKIIPTTGDGWSLDSSVGIATGYGLDDRGVGVRVP